MKTLDMTGNSQQTSHQPLLDVKQLSQAGKQTHSLLLLIELFFENELSELTNEEICHILLTIKQRVISLQQAIEPLKATKIYEPIEGRFIRLNSILALLLGRFESSLNQCDCHSEISTLLNMAGYELFEMIETIEDFFSNLSEKRTRESA